MIDTIIVGAGPSGLCMAKTILECNLDADVRILDAGSSIGGVWAKEKMYPTLKTNHFFGGMDFSDFTMPVGYGAVPNDHIPGMAVHTFLNSYAQHFSLHERVQFHTRVTDAEQTSDGTWKLKIFSPEENVIHCRKLIVTMGVNNRPHRPEFVGSSNFNAPIIHSSELGAHYDTLIQDPSTSRIAILGAGKSAYDAVHMASSAGKQVDWIIRRSGKGPVWVFPMVTKMGPFEVQRDKMTVRRLVTFFSPCIWNDGFKWIRDLVQKSKIGAFITRLFWAKLHASAIQDCNYHKHPQTALLQPQQSPFYYGTTGGSCKYLPELFERISQGQVRVYREDIERLDDHCIRLADGQVLEVDALVTATGFSAEPTINFTPSRSHGDLGIPTTKLDPAQHKFWAGLDNQSDKVLLYQFPTLMVSSPKRHQPTSTKDVSLDLESKLTNEAREGPTPFRLYRSIAPPGPTTRGDRSLVFLGVFSNFANHARLEVQCLWAHAYLEHKLFIDEKTVYQEASMLSRYSRYRTPLGHGHAFPDHVFDQLPYFDTLLGDLGLSTLRKSNWFKELFEPYHVTDYKGIVQEWLTSQGKR